MIRFLRTYLMPRAGRKSPIEAAAFGRSCVHGFGFIAVGRVALIFDLLSWLQKDDQFRVPTLAEVNAAIRTAEEAEREATKNPG